MRCPSCKNENPPGTTFCGMCGARQEVPLAPAANITFRFSLHPVRKRQRWYAAFG